MAPRREGQSTSSTTEQPADLRAGDLHVEVIETSSIGDRSYLATDGRNAVVIDPQRDVDRMIAAAGRLGASIALVLETHIHNDYVSGGLELARLTGADYGVAADDERPRRPLVTPRRSATRRRSTRR